MPESNQDRMLQQYFDSELPEAEAEALRLEIESDAELQAKLDGLTHLRGLIQSAMAPEHLALAPADELFSELESRLARPDRETAEGESSLSNRPKLRVLEGGEKREKAAPTPAPSRVPAWIGVGGLTLAAAAALWFFVLRPADTIETPPQTPDPVAVLTPPPGSEIEEIDLGHSTGAIFQIEDEGAQYAVVWIGDEKPEDHLPEGAVDDREERLQ
ncbi:MAG TPA: hypothetical protein ENK57_12830 [Polyangiaceae bacterium]|nr:hypothetical protein [Polyangiaceae bacterium]